MCLCLFVYFAILESSQVYKCVQFVQIHLESEMLKSWYYEKAPCYVSEQISKQKGSLLGCFDSAPTQNNLQQAVGMNKILNMKEINCLKN